MSEQEPNQEQEPRSEATPEKDAAPKIQPRIYVASLADYNAGRLYGAWIAADQTAEELQITVRDMLAKSPENKLCQRCGKEADVHPMWENDGRPRILVPGKIEVLSIHDFFPGKAEEWAIHDYEGFGKLHLSEYEIFETISALGLGIAEHGAAFSAYASLVSWLQPEALGGFDDAYQGTWSSVEEYAEDLLESIGAKEEFEKISESLQPYITLDMEGFARDLQLGGDITVVEGDGCMHIFQDI